MELSNIQHPAFRPLPFVHHQAPLEYRGVLRFAPYPQQRLHIKTEPMDYEIPRQSPPALSGWSWNSTPQPSPSSSYTISPVSRSSLESPPSNDNAAPTATSPVFAPKRPFKNVTSSASCMPLLSALDPAFEAEYEQFRRKIMAGLAGSSDTHRNMRRNVPINPEKLNDPEYLEKRKKNNMAAKKSREARKAKEDELAIRVAFFEAQILKCQMQLAQIHNEKQALLSRRNV